MVVVGGVPVEEDALAGNGAAVEDPAPAVDSGTVVVGVGIPVVNATLGELGEDSPIVEDVPSGNGASVDNDGAVVDVVATSGATPVVDSGAVVVGYDVTVVEDDGVPDVDGRLVEAGAPVGTLDGAVVVISTHAMIPTVT